MNENLNKFTALDVETTGLKEPAICSLALIRVENKKIECAKYFLINPEKEIEYGAYKVHGISNKDVEKQPNFAEVWEDIKSYISGQIIIGHNVNFDARCIIGACKRYGLMCLPFKTICTCKNAKKFISKSEVENYKLDTICDYFGIKLNNHHDARDDADACRLIFNKLRDMGELDIKQESLA